MDRYLKRLNLTIYADDRQTILELLDIVKASLSHGTDFEGKFDQCQEYSFRLEDIIRTVPGHRLAEVDPNKVTELFLEELDHTPNYAEVAT